MCFVQKVKNKSVLTFQPIRTPKVAFTSANNAKPVATFSKFHLGSKNRKLPYSHETLHISLPEIRNVTTKLKKRSFLLQKCLRLSKSTTPELESKKTKIIPFIA